MVDIIAPLHLFILRFYPIYSHHAIGFSIGDGFPAFRQGNGW